MRLSEILKPIAVRVCDGPHDKSGIITELVQLAAGTSDGAVLDATAATRAVLEREAIKTTSIGRGVAAPHAKTPVVRRLIMSMAICRQPVAFDSLDGQPVSVLVLLLAPPEQTGPYLQALARVAKLMSQTSLREQLINVADGLMAHKLLCDEEARLLK